LLAAARTAAAQRLAAAGVASPALDARLLLQAATGADAAALTAAGDRPLAGPEAAAFDGLVGRRAAREPVSRILGRREFYGRDFRLTPDVLDPRPETETVVEAALAALRGIGTEHPLILDLGTGSGALLVTLLAECRRARGVGLDLAPAALVVARANARAHGVADRAAFVAGDWMAPLGGRFDLVVANPPYVPRAALAGLAPEVRAHDPLAALDGGEDGLDAYRAIASDIAGRLGQGAALLVEVGAGQAPAVRRILARSLRCPEADMAVHRDLAGRARVVSICSWQAGQPRINLEPGREVASVALPTASLRPDDRQARAGAEGGIVGPISRTWTQRRS
jgi:release factor glutamine methyltransferase